MICGSPTCGCAFESSTLNVTRVGDVITLEQAQFTDITALQIDVAALKVDMAAAQGDIVAVDAAKIAKADQLSAETTPSGIISSSDIRVTRIPLAAGNFLVHVYGSLLNVKGSALVAGDLLFTIPVGYRGAQNNSLIINLSSNTTAGVNVANTGLVTFGAGTVSNNQYIRILAAYET